MSLPEAPPEKWFRSVDRADVRLAALCLLSLVLNAIGMTWGLPARWHPDEKADAAHDMAVAGRLRPDSFINPSLPLYLMMPPLWLQDGAARAGWLGTGLEDPLLVGRGLSALAGAGAVLAVGLAARRRGRQGAWAPPLLLALAPGFVNLCHFATPEPWLLLGSATTLALALAHLEGRVPVVSLGVVLGLTASTKYTAAALLVPVLLAIWLAPIRRRPRPLVLGLLGVVAVGAGLALALGLDVTLAGRLHLKDARLLLPARALEFVRSLERLALATGVLGVVVAVFAWRRQPWAERLARPEGLTALACAGLGFVAGTPHAVVTPLSFLSDLAFNHQTRFEYKGLVGASTAYGPYLGLLGDALTTPLLVAALAGAVLALARLPRDRHAAVLLSAFVAPYVLVASSGHSALRFLAPVLPAAAILAGGALAAISPRPVRRLATVLLVTRTALGAVLVLRLFFVDSRSLASRWLEAHVARGTTIDVIANSPGYAPTAPEGRTLRVVPTLSREMAPAERFLEAAARYPREASPWLILTAAYYQRFLDHPEQRPERASFFREILGGRGGFTVAARFQQQGWLRPEAEFLDPEIVILRKDAASLE